jgi:predicted dehydrogenase
MDASPPVGVGIVGAGVISGIYLENLTGRLDNVRVIGIADLLPERAQAQAAKHGVAALTVDELLAHPDVEIVVNLTIPAAHGDVGLRAIEAGKSVYNEKPLSVTREEARALLDHAAARGVRVGGAPDTFLGGGLQTARALLDAGAIGRPVAAAGSMLTRGHERWHPNPDFYYQPGGGPLFDMGPYYLTALLSLLGPVARVSAVARASYPTRTIAGGPRAGEVIPVETPTHIVTALELAAGPTASLLTTFDVWDTSHSALMLYGSEGTLRLPDPNTFDGPVELLRAGAEVWEPVELRHGWTDNSRGLGVSDMARALRDGGPHRASGEMAYHVVDVMHAALESSEQGRHVTVASTFDLPAPLPQRA